MSYYTRLELQWDDADYALGTLTPEMVCAAAEDFILRSGWSRAVLDDLRVSAAGKSLGNWGYNDVCAEALIEMFREISRAFPVITFFVRGIGEDMVDTWIREFRAGEVIAKFGPFEPSAEVSSQLQANI